MDPRNSAQDVTRCDLCETAMVQMHCDTCLVNLCKGCVGEHISNNESKDHKVVKFQSRKSTPLYPGCASHEKEQCEMYCRHCNIPVCHSCLESDQHIGHKLSKILHVLHEKKDLIRKEQNELNKSIYPTYQGIAVDVQNRMRQLQEEYGDLSTAITKHGEDVHREIDKIVRKLKTQVDEMKTSQIQTSQKYLDEINKNIVDIKDEINSLDLAAESNDISVSLNVRSKLDQYRKLPQKLVLSVPKFIKGTIQRELYTLFGALSPVSLESEGHSYSVKATQNIPKVESFVEERSPEIGFKPPVAKLLKTAMIFSSNISYSGNHLNVACVKNETIFVSGDSGIMTLLSINQNSVLRTKTITTKSGNRPADIAVSRNGDLIYTDFLEGTVNILKDKDIEEMIRLQNWRPGAVCSTSTGDLLITEDSDDNKQSRVVRYSGTIKKQIIQFDAQGTPLYSGGFYKYICENNNHDICVADSGTTSVVVVNQAGKLRFRYNGHIPTTQNQPFNPIGITTNSQGHILTSDGNNQCVHVIEQDGHFLRYIDCGPFQLCGLCTDTDDNLFLLGYRYIAFPTGVQHEKAIIKIS